MLLQIKNLDNISEIKIKELLGLSEGALKMQILRGKAELVKVYNSNIRAGYWRFGGARPIANAYDV